MELIRSFGPSHTPAPPLAAPPSPPASSRPQQQPERHIHPHRAHEYPNRLPVIEPLRAVLRQRQRIPLANRPLDGIRGARRQVAELVRQADDGGAQGGRGQLHQADGDGAPGAADKKLLEEHRRDQRQVARADVYGHRRAADDARADHRRSPPEDAADVADCRVAEQRADLPDYGDDGGLGGGFADLFFEEGRVEVLRAVRARVEARHDDHHVDMRGPILLEREPGFARECSEPVSPR